MEENTTKHHRGRRKKKGKGHILSNIILVVAIIVFLYSGYQLYTIFAEYKEGESEYEQIKGAVITQELPVGDALEEAVFKVDFEKLLAINEDVIGWIRFDEPAQISYPIAQGVNNDQYLRTTLEGKKNTAGTIFVDYQNQGDFKDKNTFIYGHNMRNGTMFGQLRKYRDAEFYKQYPRFYIYTPDGREITYEIFAVCVVKDVSDSYDKVYESDAEFQKYIEMIRSVALYQTEVPVSSANRIVSLSTCTNVSDDERLLIHAVAVSEVLTEE